MGVYFSGQSTALAFSFASSEFEVVEIAQRVPLLSLTTRLPGFTKATQAANYYFWLQELQGTIRETKENREKGPEQGCQSYDMENVHFSYPLAADNRVLDGVTLSVSIACSIRHGRN